MPNLLLTRRDIDFYLHDWLNISSLVDRDSVDAFIDLSEKLAENFFLTHYKRSDIEEPSLTPTGVHIVPAIADALARYSELGFFSAGFPERYGGLGLPYLACAASFAYFAAANISTAAYPMLTVANARLIMTFGNPAQIENFVRPELEGRWFGTMCLSEPQAGSSLADVRARAEFDGTDELGQRFRIVGNKMWISGGDQDASDNIIHLVLAKVPKSDGTLPEGTAGLSLFIVPKVLPDGERNDIVVAGLNHKMGYRGTANCLLNFGEVSGAIGWMVGEPNRGLRQMFLMMNEARIGVGIGAAALGYRGYRLAAKYARERFQGRPVGERSGSPRAIIEHSDVKLMLLAQKAYVEGALALCLYSARLVDREHDADASALLGLLTPVTKTWSSEYGLLANDIAIQIHGGYGYTRDYDVEQLWRDNRLNLIHEGTTGIQAIDLLGRKILRDGTGLAIFERELLATRERASKCKDIAAYGIALWETWGQLGATVTVLRTLATERALDHATLFLRAFGHLVVAWLWLEQASVVSRIATDNGHETVFADGKLRACRYFFEFELPKVAVWLAPVASCSDVVATAPIEMF